MTAKRALALSAALALALQRSDACPFSRMKELNAVAADHQRSQRQLLGAGGGGASVAAGLVAASKNSQASSSVAMAATTPSAASIGSASSYAASQDPTFYKGPTTPSGKPDLAVIDNPAGSGPAIAEFLHRFSTTLDSLTQYMLTIPTFVGDLVTPVPGANHNLISGSFQGIYESLTDAHQQGSLAFNYTIANLPLITRDHLLEGLNSLEEATKILQVDQSYSTAFKVLMMTVSPVTYGLTLRLAFHDAGSYNPNAPAGTSKGGANGSIRYEFDWPSNGGLQRFMWPSIYFARQLMDKILPGNNVGYADLVAIAGAVGTFMTKGPFINVGYGRPDASQADPFAGVGSDTNDARDYPISELLFEWNKFGFNATELTVLSGAHGIGIAASTNPQGKINGMGSLHFGSQYYKNVKDGIAFFGSDKALFNDPSTRVFVEQFAASSEVYFSYFRPIYTRLTMLGVDPSIELHTQRF